MAKNKEIDVLQEYKKLYNDALSNWGQYWQEAHKDLRFYMGDQWDSKYKSKLKREGRNAYSYNYMRRIVKMITGHQRKNRLSLIVKPQESSDKQASDILSDLLIWQMQTSNGNNTISEAFEGAVVTGINLLEVWIDYTQDIVNGEIKIDRVPFNSFIIDPQFEKRDLSDCRFIIRRKYISKDEAKSLLPKKAKELDDLNACTDDNMFSYMSHNRHKTNDDIVSYDEFWKRKTKKAKVLIDQTTGEYIEWQGNKTNLKEYLKEFPWVKAKTIYKPTVELNIIVGGVHIDTIEDPYEIEDFPFVPVMGYYEPQLDDYSYKLQGVLRAMRDPQEDFNKRRSTAMDIIESQANTGWIVRNGAIDNPTDITKTGQGAIIFRSRASNPDDITPIRPSEVSNSIFQLMQQSQQDMMQIPGVSEELMGIADTGNSEISGILAKVRSSNSLTTLQDLFDNLALSQKLLGKKIIKLIQNNYTLQKIQRITNKEPTQEIFDKDLSKYDLIVAEGLLTDTQRSMHYAQIMQAKMAGISIPDSAILNAMPIQDKDSLMQAFEQESQMQQAHQQAIQEQSEIERKLKNSEIINNLSLAAERRSRMVADEALARERLSEAQQNRAKMVVEQIKAVQEIEEIDRKSLIENIQFIAGLQEEGRQQNREDVRESSDRAFEEVMFTSQLGTDQQQPNQMQVDPQQQAIEAMQVDPQQQLSAEEMQSLQELGLSDQDLQSLQ